MKNRIQSGWFTLVLFASLAVAVSGLQLQAQTTASPMNNTTGAQSATQSQPPAQTPQQQDPSQTTQPPGGHTAQAPDPGAGQAHGAQVFTGQIVKAGDKYVLQDAASGMTFDIDHQEVVSQYGGKRVRVKGVLDPNGKMIHIQGGQH